MTNRLAAVFAASGLLFSGCSNPEAAPESTSLPPGEAEAMARLNDSPRHGEWVVIPAGRNPVTGENDSTRLWVVFPERSTSAPVVIVIHEIFGLTPWVRAMADQLAAEGFIAIAPDLITMKNVAGNPVDGPDRDQATSAIRSLSNEELNRQIDAVAEYGMSHSAATEKYGVIGFCWGGRASFLHATHAPDLAAAVVFYGDAPALDALTGVSAPVLGLYAGDDARVNASIPEVDSAMRSLSRAYRFEMFAGAGHGFMRQASAANAVAARRAWPLAVQFLNEHLEIQ